MGDDAPESQQWDGRVFVFWPNPDPMSEARSRCLETLVNTQCDVVMIDRDNLASWIVDGHPLHPAYASLSAVHKSDYLRAYFMHHHGGGYTDIKNTRESWRPTFEKLRRSDALGAGYAEFRRGVAKIARNRVGGRCYWMGRKSSFLGNYLAYKRLKHFHHQLIGNCAFMFKPGTVVTAQWLAAVERRLEDLLPQLQQHPARYPRERPGSDSGDGPSQYPVPWTFLLGDIVGPLSYRYRRQMLRCLPMPDFENYE